ncbi:oxygen-independent coproporphyrinogen III oxidase [Thermotomaculum hydrothermale]|uniref:Heme chaperone HemW n=1 Tax=Thermotomaculum hydrothermale TaxID=981385 RepID=A0A7R6PLM4_9BACT|nr:radical SAM family heme chaperone HemW [Thermotomaculum hydrothermale]BBB32347.1 oxygen-independent coproporphyrinogen III oxidase [Thermotomaculum hydrothermale]
MEIKNNFQGLYVHIPYCIQRCKYCSFYSRTGKIEEDKYLNSLTNHFNFLIEKFDFVPRFETLYFGGGTPSLMSLNFFESFLVNLNRFMDISNFKEITIEANPETLTQDYLKGLKGLGVNRISIGVQSTDDNILKKLNRVHNSKKAVDSVELALRYFNNVSVDFIIGIKGQEEKSVKEIFNFPLLDELKHISVYMLEGDKNIHLKADDDFSALLYKNTIDFLGSKGFYQYEISNFAKNGFQSLHNSLYWTGNNYLGIGVSAHSYKYTKENKKGKRFSELPDYNNFVKSNFKAEVINLEFEDLVKEFFMLGLRMKKGVDRNEFKDKWGVDPFDYFKPVIEKFIEFFIFDGNRISLTIDGFLLSNEIFEEIIF